MGNHKETSRETVPEERALGHEKLHVYQRALAFVSWEAALLAGIEGDAAVLDHLDRASDSIVEAIANGNSRRSPEDRNRYFDVATGSALECAACLDVCARKQLVSGEKQTEGKGMLLPIVRMTIGLRAGRGAVVREEGEPYLAGAQGQAEALFFHEKLDAYQLGLDLVGWLDGVLRQRSVAPRSAAGLDKATTSLVLNIAEGNGRYSNTDHRRFLDIALTCAMNTAAGLDLLAAKGGIRVEQVVEGKRILGRIVPMLLGLRGYLERSETKT
ncbi:MAG: four helix bundle protein [Planctomycetota bacterium]